MQISPQCLEYGSFSSVKENKVLPGIYPLNMDVLSKYNNLGRVRSD